MIKNNLFGFSYKTNKRIIKHTTIYNKYVFVRNINKYDRIYYKYPLRKMNNNFLIEYNKPKKCILKINDCRNKNYLLLVCDGSLRDNNNYNKQIFRKIRKYYPMRK